ncbi:unnamed protein product [Schistosoma mattheei]|uniref:Uncharacterized protein n=1 Tax=Schistosoma mattheei TaxID=31246 RepID=A0A183P426_9TREM|nr:unnamed protein product [Schistosoma mattheei]
MSGRTALFGRPQQSQTRHLLQFKAGKMTIGDDNWVHADPRKGWVSSAQANAVTIGRHLNTGHLDESNVSTSVIGTTATPSSGTSSTSGNSLRPSTTDKRLEAGKIQLQDLRNILSSISTGIRSSSNDAKVELNDVLNVDNLHSLLNKPDIQERLLPHLPPLDPESASTNDLENITANIQSSQFKTTLKSFSAAFRTGELAPVLAQFNLGIKADEAARRGGKPVKCFSRLNKWSIPI